MSKCALLIRVSTDAQDLSQQTEKVKNEAKKDGYTDNDIIVIEDKESAVKLSEEERNGLNNLKWYIENEPITCVYAYEVSRISRQAATLYHIRDFLIKHNVQLVILKPYIKLLNDDGTISETSNLFFGLFTSLAENEGYLRKARCKRGIDRKKKLGLWGGGNIPFGYKLVNDRLVIDEDEAVVVRRIFNDYINGLSSMTIAVNMSNEGVWLKSATTINAMKQNVLNVLHRAYYYGDAMHPAIITKEMYEKAREIAKSKTTYETGKEDISLFKGIIFNDKGVPMYPNNSSEIYISKGVTLSFKIANSFLWGVVSEWYNQIYHYKYKEMIERLEDKISQQTNIINTMKSNITDNQDKIDRIEERYIEGKITKSKADELERQTFSELQIFKRKLHNAEAEQKRLIDIKNNKKPITIDKNITWNDKREIVKDVVSRVEVKKVGFFVVEVLMVNKISNERRTLTINGRKCEIIGIKVQLLPGLSDGSR